MIEHATLTSVELVLVDANHPLRDDIEHYVYQRYSLAFHADIDQFMPVFLVLFEYGEIRSVCGLRDAGKGPLFLEQYLDASAETLLSAQFSQPIERGQVIEFGQLASFSNGFSPLHFYLMAQKLTAMGYAWCLCTVTGPLFSLMRRLGLHPVVLSDAQPGRIADAAKWGDYYHAAPRVIAGNLIESYTRLHHAIMPWSSVIDGRRKTQ